MDIYLCGWGHTPENQMTFEDVVIPNEVRNLLFAGGTAAQAGHPLDWVLGTTLHPASG